MTPEFDYRAPEVTRCVRTAGPGSYVMAASIAVGLVAIWLGATVI
jgi:hypothetical protein